MIQNTPIDLPSVTGFATQRSESDSFKMVIYSAEPENENDSAALAPFEVELKKAAAKSPASQKSNEDGYTEVVAVALPDPEVSFQASEDTGFEATSTVHVDDRPKKAGPESTPPTQSELNQTVFVFAHQSQPGVIEKDIEAKIETDVEAKIETLDPALLEKYGIHQIEIPVINAETLEPYAISPTTSMVDQPDDGQIIAKQTNASPITASPTNEPRVFANTTYATPAIATPIRTEQSSSIQTIDIPTIGKQPGATQPSATRPLDTQPIDARPIDARPIDIQPNESLARAEHASALRIFDDQTISSQTSAEPDVARRIAVAQTNATPARTELSATAHTVESQTGSREVPAQATRIPTVADAPLSPTNSIAGQATVESEINLASRAPVDPKAIADASPEVAVADVSPEVAVADESPEVAIADATPEVPITDASQDVIKNLKPFSAVGSQTVREPSVETLPNVERVDPTADSESSRDAEPLAAETSSSQDSFSQSDDRNAGLIPEPLEVSLSAEDSFQTPLEIESVASDPSHQTDRPKPTQPAQVSHHDIYLPEPAVRSVNETLARPNSLDRSIPEIGRLVSQRVSETLIQEVQAGGKNDSKHLLLHLHPEELGKLTVRVGLESDLIIAKIVASELATSEMLNRDKAWLMDSLQASGLEIDSFEVSYESSTNDGELSQNGRSSTSIGERDPDPANTTTDTSPTIDGRGSVVNLIA